MIRQLVSSVRRLARLTIPVGVVLVGIAAVLSFSHVSASSGCRSVRGRVVDQHVANDLSVATMIGSINGLYTVTVLGGDSAGTIVPSVYFFISTSVVETKKGDISFSETASLDTAEQDSVNGVALLTITEGTGDWQGASGHLLLSGYFHTSTGTGEWDYQGEVCLP
jgi:hypothetical protein